MSSPTDSRTPADLSHADPADRYEAIVVGGGPAGSTAAALLAEAGHSVLLLERAPFPRFHVGESLIPETYWTLHRLGVIPQLRASAFPKKYSVQFVSETGRESAPFYFDEHNPHESSQTWQVWRDEFDRMLLENAAVKGADVRTQAHVTEVLFEEGQAVGVDVRPANGREEAGSRTISARVVIDATGQSAFLASRFGLKQADPVLRKASIWTYFRGAYRDSGRDEGATIILQTPEKKSWFWYIPLPDDVVSVGCTGGMDYLFAPGRGSAEEVFAQEVARCPALQRRLASGERCRDFFVTKDYSYRTVRSAGPGWVLTGDALGFIDPVYSSGVFLALKSGEWAADAVHEALQVDDFSAERLGGWQPRFREGVELFRKLVYAFYTPGFSFGEFLRTYPEYRSNLVDILIGAVFKPGVGEMFEAMGGLVPAIQNAADSTLPRG